MKTVVAAFIKKDDKVFIARRSTGNSEVIGKWEFPGGKLEENETEEVAIEREMMEEFEVKVKAIKFLTNNVCEYPGKVIDLRLYECDYIDGEFNLHDHYEYKWINVDELLSYDLCKADIPLAEYVINKKN